MSAFVDSRPCLRIRVLQDLVGQLVVRESASPGQRVASLDDATVREKIVHHPPDASRLAEASIVLVLLVLDDFEDDALIRTAWRDIAVHQGDDVVVNKSVLDELMLVVLAERMVDHQTAAQIMLLRNSQRLLSAGLDALVAIRYRDDHIQDPALPQDQPTVGFSVWPLMYSSHVWVNSSRSRSGWPPRRLGTGACNIIGDI